MNNDWLEEIKNIAHEEAEVFVNDMEHLANEHDIEPDWFINEVLSNVRKIKGGAE